MGTQSNSSNKGSNFHTRVAQALAGVVCAGMLLSGCGSPKTPPATSAQLPEKSTPMDTQPIVLSGHPDRDTAAFVESDDKLSDADWKELELLGPRPIWEQITAKSARHKCHKHVTTAPVVAKATTQPALDESTLPAQSLELPDGRVRIIWTLQNVGGPAVKAGRDSTNLRTVQIAPADLAPIVGVLTQALSGTGGVVMPLAEDNAVIVTCPKALKPTILTLLNDLDHPAKQVEITAKIFEVSHDFDFQQGTELVLNRLASGNSQNLTSVFSAKRFLDAVNSADPSPVQGSVLHLIQAFQSAGVSVDVSFQLLADAGLIQVVSEPRMTVAVGQTGYMQAGQEIPIQSTNISNAVVTLATTYKPVGVQLYVTPEVAGPSRVKLHTISVVSSVSGFSAFPLMNGGSNPLTNPVIDSREAETAVTVDEGSTLVISGLRTVRTTTREEKVPGIGDVPVLGWLFKNHRTQQQKTDLYFFITPTLL